MKKIILCSLACAALLTACDPSKDNISSPTGAQVTAEQLADGFTYTQYAQDDAGNYTEAADGNFIKFATSPSEVVKIYQVNDGEETVLSSGKANGMFTLAPSRGQSPEQVVYIECRNWDGTTVTTQKTITVHVATSISKQMLILCSNSGSKAWKWDCASYGTCWGNMGWDGNGDWAGLSGYKWWGVADAADLSGQSNHAVSGTFQAGEADNEATMVFNETGKVVCYDKDGNEIRKGSFEIQDYDADNKSKVGTLHTSEGATLFPYEINAGGKYVTDFEIRQLTPDKLLLTYPDGGAWSGSWQEATYWAFSSDDDPDGFLTANDAWTWDCDTYGTCWGNMGWDGSGDWGGLAGYKWWGVADAADLSGQSNHAVAGTFQAGEASNDAYMVFGTDGKVKCYDASNNEIRKGTWSIQGWNGSAGTLATSEGATLFPYEINAGGKYVTAFLIKNLSMDNMVLIYPDGGDWSGSWQEATYWAFKKKSLTK